MRSSRRAATAAVSISLALAGVAATHADADSAMVLYVATESASCTDSGTGTQAAPYCTIQAAADAAVAGDTVDIAPGMYPGQVDIASVGTPAAPIVFQAEGPVFLSDAANQTGPALSLDGASSVSFDRGAATEGTADGFAITGVEVNGSSNIGFDGVSARPVVAPGAIAFHVTGTSSNVALTRSTVGSVQIDAGSSGDVISTNLLGTTGGSTAVSVSGASNTDITSNDIESVPAQDNAISVSAGSTGTSIENNIIAYSAGPPSSASAPVVAVDASSAAGTTLDYNVVYPAAPQLPYAWAGTDYASAAALDEATGQGAHDLNADPEIGPSSAATHAATAPQINSANSSAPGMLGTDFYGAGCGIDPAVAVTGVGTPAYCARGAVQQSYSGTITTSSTTPTALSVDYGSSLTQNGEYDGVSWGVTPGPTPDISYTIDWGDGQTQTVQASSTNAVTNTPHRYARVGTYIVTNTANLTDGETISTKNTVSTAGSGFTPLGPDRFLDTRHDIGGSNGPIASGQCDGLDITGLDGIPSNATAVAVNLTVTDTKNNGYFFLGYDDTASNLNYTAGQTVANSAIVQLNGWGGIAVCNGGNSDASADAIVDVTGYFATTTGAGYQPTTLKRILDTRDGTGAPKAKVGAKSGLTVPIANVDSIPSGVTAVAVHVTETNATGGGFIAAEPDGAGVPTTSSLNYAPGQTISNTLIVPVAKDGKIELYNGATGGSVDLIADISGFFAASAPDAFIPVTPFRAVDTRQVGSKIASDGTESLNLDSTLAGASAGFPADATLAANLTATDETAGGSLTVFPAGTALPNVSALNFGRNQNIATFGLFAASSSADTVSVYDNSPGSTDVVIDVFGYFTNS